MGWPGAWEGFVESEKKLMLLREEQKIVAACVAQFGADGSGFSSAPGPPLSAPDEAVFADDTTGTALAASVTEAFHQGVGGYAQDVFVQCRPWPFDPARITAPVDVVHGALDTLIPLAHGRHTAAVIAGSRFRTLTGHGHLSIVSELPALLSTLVPSG
jgi:pimeloyl-ACP methyl ester carboxylesterase